MKRTADYKALSTAELEALLCAEMETADPTTALAILAELEARQGSALPEAPWDSFCTHYLPLKAPLYPPVETQKPRVFSFARRLGATAAAACLACMLAVHAGGIDILRSMIHWTGDALLVESPAITSESSFVSGTEDAARKAASSPAPGAGEWAEAESTLTACDSLSEGLSLLSLESWTPTAIPAGFSFSSAEVETLSGVQALHAVYTNEAEDLLQLSCRRYSEESVFSSVFTKDDAEVETVELHGVTFYFISNGRYESAVWMVDEKTECHISGPVTRDELKDMISSMSS